MNAPAKAIYVARDIERALGMEPSPSYLVVANRTPYAESVREGYPDFVTLIDSADGDVADTAELLGHPTVRDLIYREKAPILVFKNTSRIEEICRAEGWTLLNPPAALAEKIENKISQAAWLGEIGSTYLPPHEIIAAQDIAWKKDPFILQWAHGHTGESTLLIDSKKNLAAIAAKFPKREARVTQYVNGPSFTVNVAVTIEKILMGNISYQITGMAPFTDREFTTIGNDWSLTHSILDDSEIETIEGIARDIGIKMQAEGWRGLFGIDVMRDDERDRVCLIEINARQPASSVFESFLQEQNRAEGLDGPTVFESHIEALLGSAGTRLSLPPVPLNDGAQIVQRVTKDVKEVPPEALGSLELAGYRLISYPNTAANADLLRIQGTKGIMETHMRFNKRGQAIVDILSA